MSDWEDYFGQAGDMASGSQNPGEQNDWLDKQQKEQERQRKALERQQQRLMNPGNSFTATPHRPDRNRPDRKPPSRPDFDRNRTGYGDVPDPAG